MVSANIAINEEKVEKVVRAIEEAIHPDQLQDNEVKTPEVVCALLISYGLINLASNITLEMAIQNATNSIIELYNSQDEEAFH